MKSLLERRIEGKLVEAGAGSMGGNRLWKSEFRALNALLNSPPPEGTDSAGYEAKLCDSLKLPLKFLLGPQNAKVIEKILSARIAGLRLGAKAYGDIKDVPDDDDY